MKDISDNRSVASAECTDIDAVEHKCGKCGREHPPRKCPAFGKVCNNCKNANHFAKCCRVDGTKFIKACISPL